jgi:hypothetical protein
MTPRPIVVLIALLPVVFGSIGCVVPESGSPVSAGTFLIADAYPLTMYGPSALAVGSPETYVLTHPINPKRVVWDSTDPKVVAVEVAADDTQPRRFGTPFCSSCCENQRCGMARALQPGVATITARMTFIDGSTATARLDVRAVP